MDSVSLMTRPRVLPLTKQSGALSQNVGAYCGNAVRTNEIAGFVISGTGVLGRSPVESTMRNTEPVPLGAMPQLRINNPATCWVACTDSLVTNGDQCTELKRSRLIPCFELRGPFTAACMEKHANTSRHSVWYS